MEFLWWNLTWKFKFCLFPANNLHQCFQIQNLNFPCEKCTLISHGWNRWYRPWFYKPCPSWTFPIDRWGRSDVDKICWWKKYVGVVSLINSTVPATRIFAEIFYSNFKKFMEFRFWISQQMRLIVIACWLQFLIYLYFGHLVVIFNPIWLLQSTFRVNITLLQKFQQYLLTHSWCWKSQAVFKQLSIS